MAKKLSDFRSLTYTYEFPGIDSEAKLRELMLYIADKCFHDRYFGAIKLNKILYYSDFESFRLYGRPITGVEYQRLPQGPAPKRLKPIRDDMESKGEAVQREIETMRGTQKRLIALRKPDLDMFSAQEIDIVNKAIRLLWNKTATQTSKATHRINWRIYDDYDPMPYESYLLDENITDDDIERAKELSAKYGWN